MRYRILILLFTAFFVISCDDKKDESAQKGDDNSTKLTKQEATIGSNYDAPFTITLANDKKLLLQKSKDGLVIQDNDKALMLVFMTTWCPPCNAQIPALVALGQKYSATTRIIGVIMDDVDLNFVQNFIKTNNINFDIAVGSDNETLKNVIGGITSMPLIIFYDNSGKKIDSYTGAVPYEMLETQLKQVVE